MSTTTEPRPRARRPEGGASWYHGCMNLDEPAEALVGIAGPELSRVPAREVLP